MMSILCFLFSSVVSIYIWILIIAVVLTYVQPNQNNQAVQFIYQVTDPVFVFTKKYLQFMVISGIDFSPIVIIFLLQYLPKILCSIIWF